MSEPAQKVPTPQAHFPTCHLCLHQQGVMMFQKGGGTSLSFCVDCARFISHGYLDSTRDYPDSLRMVQVVCSPGAPAAEGRPASKHEVVALFTNPQLAQGLMSKHPQVRSVEILLNDPVKMNEAIVHYNLLMSGRTH